MKFQRQRRRPIVEAVIDITSLVDVVFLLLIFLLVTTTFKRREYAFPLALPTATETELVVRTDRPTVFVSREGEFFFLDTSREGEPPPERSAPMSREALERQLADLVAREPSAEVSVKAEGTTSYQHFVDVMDACRTVGIQHVLLPYELSERAGGAAADGAPAAGE